MSRLVYIETFGCQMNAVDSARMLALLESADYRPAPSLADADLVLLNTCSIREKADQKIRSALGELRRWKSARAGRMVAVGGCLAQQEGARLAGKAPHVDVVFGTHSIARLPDLIRDAEKGSSRIDIDLSGDTGHWETPPCLPDGSVTAMVTIMQGCDNYCAYCIVPHVRGNEISRSSRAILDEVRGLADRGVAEVILLGQNVNSYGRKEGEISFPRLVRKIAAIPGIARIRFITSHPRDLDPETIGLFGEIETLCPHVHLPLQSGSDRILSLMGRGYTRDEYLSKVNSLRGARPGIAFSSDFIVGFPGEREEDFVQTLAAMEEVRYDSVFSFRFSPRPGTRAASMPDAVPSAEAGRRLRRLQSLQEGHTRLRLDACIGKQFEVLVEGRSARDEAQHFGRTPCYKAVNFTAETTGTGPFRRVRIKAAGSHSLSGVEGDHRD